MIKRKKVTAGDLLKIPFKDGVHTYARILGEGSCLIYDCPSTEDRSDFENITKSEILFIARDNGYGVSKGFWPIVANIPLDKDLAMFHPRYFNPAPTNSEDVAFYELNKEEIEDAIRKDWAKTSLHLNGTHDMVHIESRINDYYDGKVNQYNKGNTDLFKQYLRPL